MNVQHSVDQWVSKAESDMTAAKDLYRLKSQALDAICYHCQQTAEKYIKAVMVSENMNVPHTHNLPRLIGMIACVAEMDEDQRRDAAWLSEFAIEIRYPSERGCALSREHAADAIRIAAALKEFRLKLLPYTSIE
ncbi:MAG: HEPN domain-containing protein [Verrucomicrobiota bacterium]